MNLRIKKENQRIGLSHEERIAIISECVNNITYSTGYVFTRSTKKSIKPKDAVKLLKMAFLKVTDK